MSVEDRSGNSDALTGPIILIGAGRSGSTLFARMLDAHPDVQFLGETAFLIARLWREVWDNRFWLNFEYHMRREPRSSREAPAEVPTEAIDAARDRAARGVRLLLAELMQLRPGVTAWGFKEIWNGSNAVAAIPWSVYEAVFPSARWVHLVRDPFTFVRSLARWNQMPLTTTVLADELRRWQQVTAWSALLKDRHDVFEIRFEDLVAEPEATLSPILAAVGATWHEDCGRAMGQRIMASGEGSRYAIERTLSGEEIAAIVDQIPGLSRLMGDLGYTLPSSLEFEARNETIEKTLPDYIDLRSMTAIKDVFLPAPPPEKPLATRIRKAVKHFINPTPPRKAGKKLS